MPDRAKHAFHFVRYVLLRFERNGGMQTAAALTYATLFAVVPLMTVTYSMLSVVSAFQGVGEVVQGFIFDNFVPGVGAQIQARLVQFSEQARQLTGVGIVFLVVTAFTMLVNVEMALNKIWAVREPRKGLSRFLQYWAVLTLSPLLIGVGLVVSSYLFSLPFLGAVRLSILNETAIALLPFLSSWAALTIIYIAIPNTRVPFIDALVGALLATVLIEGAKHGFALVVRRSSVEVIYGTFAAVPLFLAWLFLTWNITLLGAEVVHARVVHRFEPRHGGASTLFVTLQFLERVYRQHCMGGGLPDHAAQPVLQQLGPDRLPGVLDGLLRVNIVYRDSSGAWLPGRSFDVVTLADVHRALPGVLIDQRLLIEISGSGWMSGLRERVRNALAARERAFDVTLANLFGEQEVAARHVVPIS